MTYTCLLILVIILQLKRSFFLTIMQTRMRNGRRRNSYTHLLLYTIMEQKQQQRTLKGWRSLKGLMRNTSKKSNHGNKTQSLNRIFSPCTNICLTGMVFLRTILKRSIKFRKKATTWIRNGTTDFKEPNCCDKVIS